MRHSFQIFWILVVTGSELAHNSKEISENVKNLKHGIYMTRLRIVNYQIKLKIKII